MADNMQLPPGGPGGFTAVAAQPGSEPGRALVTAVLLVVAGALLGLLGGVIWAAAAPRVIYQLYSHNPPVAYATNPETSAFIATDGIYTFIAVGGGALLGLAGYLLGVRRYGPVPMAGVVLGGVAAAFLTQWLGPVLTGQGGFNSKLNTSKPGALLRAPIGLGAHGALALWPVAAAFVAGGLELVTVMRARQRSQAGGPGARAVGRHAQRAVRGQPSQPSQPSQPDDGPWPESRLRPHSDEPAVRGTGTGSQQRFPADPEDGAQSPPLARPAGAHQQWPGGPSGQAGRVGGDSAEVPPDRDG